MDPAQLAGMVFGVMAAPAVAVAALARRGRVFHTEGGYFEADAVPLATEGSVGKLAERLAGRATARFSSGGQRRLSDKRRDVVGCTLRFHHGAAGAPPATDDQDLLLASFENVGELQEAARTSDTRDLTANTYYTATPHRDRDVGRCTFRVVPTPATGEGGDGLARLADAVSRGPVRLVLQVLPLDGAWTDVVGLDLKRRFDADDAVTAYSPFRSGRGIEPIGFLNGARRVAYPVSQAVRGARG